MAEARALAAVVEHRCDQLDARAGHGTAAPVDDTARRFETAVQPEVDLLARPDFGLLARPALGRDADLLGVAAHPAGHLVSAVGIGLDGVRAPPADADARLGDRRAARVVD